MGGPAAHQHIQQAEYKDARAGGVVETKAGEVLVGEQSAACVRWAYSCWLSSPVEPSVRRCACRSLLRTWRMQGEAQLPGADGVACVGR